MAILLAAIQYAGVTEAKFWNLALDGQLFVDVLLYQRSQGTDDSLLVKEVTIKGAGFREQEFLVRQTRTRSGLRPCRSRSVPLAGQPRGRLRQLAKFLVQRKRAVQTLLPLWWVKRVKHRHCSSRSLNISVNCIEYQGQTLWQRLPEFP